MTTYPGVYRAKVMVAADPLQQQRVRLQIPQLLGTAVSTWAEPAFELAVPPAAGSLVWVMFEGGDINRPVYLGGMPAIR